jgi:uncharacterized OB-fold protein
MTRPLPIPDPRTAPYWEATRNDTLSLPRCTACGHYQFYPRPICNQCQSRDFAWTPCSGKGMVHSFTVVHRAPSPAFADMVPYVVANIRLAEGAHLMSNVVNCAPQEVTIGMPVIVKFLHVDDAALPIFEPDR